MVWRDGCTATTPVTGGGGKETETVSEGLRQQRGWVGAMPVTYGAVMGRRYVCYL